MDNKFNDPTWVASVWKANNDRLTAKQLRGQLDGDIDQYHIGQAMGRIERPTARIATTDRYRRDFEIPPHWLLTIWLLVVMLIFVMM